MTTASIGRAGLGRRQALAVAIYAAVVGFLVLGSLQLLSDLWTDSEDVGAAQAQLDALARRSLHGGLAPSNPDARTTGSPFLEGQTITIAGAALQQRVQDAVTKAGGVLSSSRVEIDRPEGTKGFVYLTATIEAPQLAVQTILYDLEAGMPYLFIDRLLIQSPQTFGEPEGGKMRMTIGVAGQWLPLK